MNDLDDFRAALRREPDEPYAEPDLARIMAGGARLRRRRRVLSATAGVAAAAVVVLVVVFAIRLRQPTPAPAPVAQPPSPVSTSATEPAPIGDVVGTGIKTAAGEIVLYAVPVHEPGALPGVHFGLVAGFRQGTSLQSVLMTNETRGSDRSFGFHATDGGETARGQRLPVFGYFAGPATRITTTVHGRTVAANVHRWTADPSVVIFWFDPAAVPDSTSLSPLTAYGANGERLTQ